MDIFNFGKTIFSPPLRVHSVTSPTYPNIPIKYPVEFFKVYQRFRNRPFQAYPDGNRYSLRDSEWQTPKRHPEQFKLVKVVFQPRSYFTFISFLLTHMRQSKLFLGLLISSFYSTFTFDIFIRIFLFVLQRFGSTTKIL